MAMIDYGAVVIKNGEVINKNMFFMNMLEAVGWVDQKRIRHEDCDVFTDPNPLLARSNCGYCHRAKFKTISNSMGDDKKIPIEDCHGEPLSDKMPHIDNNYFAYVGDQHFTVAIYKYTSIILVDGVEEKHMRCFEDLGQNRKSKRFKCGGVNIHMKKISNRVYHMDFQYKGDFYNIVYGYGIDSSPKIWNKIKNRYLGKRSARKVDNLYRRLLGTEFK